jgi:SanA protein
VKETRAPARIAGMKKPRLPRPARILAWSVSCLILGILLVIAACNCWLLAANSGRIFPAGADVPVRKVAIVLGTAPRVGRGKNPFFEGRMDAAARLWRVGKVRHLLVSGDNSTRDYDEPTAMRDALIARGVPARAITLDYAGFRTLDSLVRAREVFGLRDIIVVTDDWHQPRALFLAAAAGLDALGASSAELPWSLSAKTRIREWLSRVKAVADICVLRTKPRFLGESVRLPIEI